MRALVVLLALAASAAAAEPPPTVAQWIAMTPQQRMALRETTRSWPAQDRAAYWAKFDDELKHMTPAERQTLQDQAARQMQQQQQAPPAPPPDSPPVKLPKAIPLPPPGDLTGRPD